MTINEFIKVEAQQSIDGKAFDNKTSQSRPWASVSDFLDETPDAIRHVGMPVWIGVDMYHFVDDIANTSFVKYSSGGSSSDIDGGFPSETYLVIQKIEGGTP